MNEQLVVKNFGPIKDATVDFKRVTVFIGPTGGGKSTLAKLAAILQGGEVVVENNKVVINDGLAKYGIFNYKDENSFVNWRKKSGNNFTIDKNVTVEFAIDDGSSNGKELDEFASEFANDIAKGEDFREVIRKAIKEAITKQFAGRVFGEDVYTINYVPTERIFISAVEYSWAGLMRDDIGLPKALLTFANNFSLFRREVMELEIPFLDVKYIHHDGRDFIKLPKREEPLMLLETASGIQSVTPMMVLLEHLSRNTELAQNFIIEEPELNLYPTAQRDLVYWLLEKCTKGNNDLTITTHSPYVLSALNLALYANKVAELFPHQRQRVAKIIPAKYWLKAEEFSAYYVAGGGVKSIFDKKTGLLSESQLDEVSGHFADVFDKLTDLRVPEKKTPAKSKIAKK